MITGAEDTNMMEKNNLYLLESHFTKEENEKNEQGD